MHKAKKAFTLIEVMIAVMIISVVIMAMIEMYANNGHIFSTLKEKTKFTQYASFFVANSDIGLENKKMTLYDLLDEFKVEDELRRELKNIKAEVMYQELERIDLSKFDDAQSQSDDSIDKESSSGLVFKVGKTILQLQDSSTALLRLSL